MAYSFRACNHPAPSCAQHKVEGEHHLQVQQEGK